MPSDKNHADNQQVLSSNSVVGEDAKFSGTFECNGVLRVDGKFKGTVKTTDGRVIVGQSGMLKGDIYARKIVIGGKVKGNVIAIQRVELLSTGRIDGNVITPSFIVEEDAVFNGSRKIKSEEEVRKMVESVEVEEEDWDW